MAPKRADVNLLGAKPYGSIKSTRFFTPVGRCTLSFGAAEGQAVHRETLARANATARAVFADGANFKDATLSNGKAGWSLTTRAARGELETPATLAAVGAQRGMEGLYSDLARALEGKVRRRPRAR